MTGEERGQIDVGADRVEQRALRRAPPSMPCRARRCPVSLATSTSVVSSAAADAPRAVRVNFVYCQVRRSIRPWKSSPSPTGQVTGVGRSSICCLDLVEQLERVAARTVVLVEERDDRQVP